MVFSSEQQQFRDEELGVAPLLAEAGIDVPFTPLPPVVPVVTMPEFYLPPPTTARFLQVLAIVQGLLIIGLSAPNLFLLLNAIPIGGCIAFCGYYAVAKRSRLPLIIFMGFEVAGIILFGFPLLVVHNYVAWVSLATIVAMLVGLTYCGAKTWRWISQVEDMQRGTEIELGNTASIAPLPAPYEPTVAPFVVAPGLATPVLMVPAVAAAPMQDGGYMLVPQQTV